MKAKLGQSNKEPTQTLKSERFFPLNEAMPSLRERTQANAVSVPT